MHTQARAHIRESARTERTGGRSGELERLSFIVGFAEHIAHTHARKVFFLPHQPENAPIRARTGTHQPTQWSKQDLAPVWIEYRKKKQDTKKNKKKGDDFHKNA